MILEINKEAERKQSKDTKEKGEVLEDNIKKIKSTVELKGYLTGKQLKDEINEFSKAAWCGIKDIYKDDLSSLSSLHSFLIGEIIKINEGEESNINKDLIKNNLNVKNIVEGIENGKVASKIYFFNDSSTEYYFVGDLHSDDYILECILDKIDFYNKVLKKVNFKIIFLGDYVDRGKEHLKTLEKIMILKYIFPGNIYLLIGNHDGGNIKEDTVSLCVRKPEADKAEDYFILYLDDLTKYNPTYERGLIEKYLKLFRSMALIVFVALDKKVICGVHGGIPRPLREEQEIYGYISSLSDLTDEAKVNNRNETIISNILWSDPLGDREDKYNHTRRFGFTEKEFELYAEILGIDYLIRGHEANEEGFKIFFKERLYCIFGTGQVMIDGKESNPSTAYPWVKPKILKLDKNKGINLIDLYLNN